MERKNELAGGKRTKFGDATAAEQIARYTQLRKLFDTGHSFQDFFRNTYKYSKSWSIPGKNPQEVTALFEQARSELEKLAHVLRVFVAGKKKQEGVGDDESSREDLRGLVGAKGLDVERLTEAFRWTLQVYVQKAAEIGRSVDITAPQIDGLVEDMKQITQEVKAKM